MVASFYIPPSAKRLTQLRKNGALFVCLIEIIKGHATKAKNDDARLIESYRYLGYYYLLQNDKATADGYWNKVLELDPENETAKQALGIQ